MLPPLCLILLGMFEVAGVTFTQAAMESGLREAARFGVTGQLVDDPDPNARKAKILALIDKQTLGFVDMSEAKVTTEVYPGFNDVDDPEPYVDSNGNGKWDSGETYTDVNGNAKWDADVGKGGLGQSSEVVQYTVEYDYPLMTGFMAGILGGEDGKIPLKASIVLRNEPWKTS